ncbi:uncharacterized protein LOC116924839 [Daphnia magna]|uniref:uncharacterized protein LOC116924839 n=1 Tax=Daphnia magna TaxID=35525 RepID=UPI001E1BBD3B|nr:uncharacterized protein LOC116924839 [Daphnia magna]XP_045030662.1 uncharacterized protein LOC116924839 [Daphnia magna]XP_045030663.1 uncharacterized protein LOC116924839 [Daphnia magna]
MQSLQRLRSLLSDAWQIFTVNLSFDNKMNVLNTQSEGVTCQVPATEVAASLQRTVLKLKGKYLSEDGKSVCYAELKKDDLFQEFQSQAEQLVHVSLADLNPIQRKAFFINVYNTLTIHALSKVEPLPKSLLDISNFWKHSAYNINGFVFSLDDIEHGVLRANTRHPAALSKPFKEDDPRLQFSMKELDPRIHFVLNCGGKSCPAIGVYSEANLEAALNSAAKNFLSETVQIDGNIVHLSKLLMWYGIDFGSNNDEILRWVAQYLPDIQKTSIIQLLDSKRVKVVFDEYNWLINAS